MKQRRVTLLMFSLLSLFAAAVAMAGDPRVAVPAPTPLALRYYHSGNVLWVVAVVWQLIVPLGILFSGLSVRLRDAALRITGRWYLALALFTTAYLLLTFLLDLPLSYYAGFVREHEYALSNQTFGKWLSDGLKELGVNLLVVPLVLSIPLFLIRRSPRRWWLYASLLMAPIIAFSLLVSPVLFDPLFNDFHRMNDRRMEAKILQLAQRAGVGGSRVFEVDKSVDTSTVNAYVTGFMGTKRIVVWDTTLKQLSERELLVVLGHELGHFVLKHVSQFVICGAAVTLFGLLFIHLTAGAMLRRFGGRLRISGIEDLAALPLLLVLFSVASLLISPALLALSRHNEHEADRFGLEITRDNYAAATSFVKMQATNLSIPRPGPVYRFFRASHPSLGERIEFSNDYRPWEHGLPLRYGRYFQQR